MKMYESMFGKKQTLQEQISFLDLYKVADKQILDMVEGFIKQFNTPRPDILRSLSTLFATLAAEADQQVKEKQKKRKR